MPVPVATTCVEATLGQGLEELAGRLGRIGMSLAVFGASEDRPLIFCAGGEVCRRFCGADGSCRAIRHDVVTQVWADRRPRMAEGWAGCVVLAVPILHRRRLAGVAQAGYFCPDAGQSEEFARACDRLHLDRIHMANVVSTMATHPRDEAPYWLEVLGLLVDQTVDNAVARDELASFSSNLGGTYEELSLLYRLSSAMKVDTKPAEFLQSVCSELLEVMRVDSMAAVLTGGFEGERSATTVCAGEPSITHETLGALSEWALTQDLGDGGEGGMVANKLPEGLRREHPQVMNILAMPLVAGELAMGLMIGVNKIGGEFDSADLKLLHSVSGQVAAFLANNNLYDDMQKLLMGVLHVLTASIDAKDQYTCGHSQRVALISRKLAEMCRLDQQEVENAYLSGLLHDMGKIGVPESVLCKSGKLSHDEFEIMKRHPGIGANILGNIRQIQPVIPGVLHHHERMDGRGYPDGLTRNEVPVQGRIVGLADCFDAMTSSRTYRNALPLEHVVAEIIRCSGTQFDPVLVDHLLSMDLAVFLAELRQAKPMVSAISGTIRQPAA